MQKWQMSFALGRSKTSITRRQFIDAHCCSLRHLHSSRVRSSEEHNLQIPDPPLRKGRTVNTNELIQNLYLKSERRAPKPEPQRTLIRKVVREQSSSIPPSYRSVSISPGTVDARSLASRPPPPSSRSSPRGTLDARSFGAKPPSTYQVRRPFIPSSSSDRSGPRLTNTGRRPPSAREGRNGSGQFRKPAPRRPRVDSGIVQGAQAGDWEADERKYFDARRAEKKLGYVVFEPAAVTADTLHGMGPAIAVEEWGMREVVGDRLAQIERVRDDQSWAVKRYAAHLEAVREENGEEQERHELPEERKKELVTRLLGGKYVIGGNGDGSVVDEVERQTGRNGTYLPRDGESFVGKVRALLPAAMRGKKESRKAVRL